MGKLLVNKFREINPLAKRGMLLLLALLASFACLLGPRDAAAAPTVNNDWTNVYAATNAALTANVTSATFEATANTRRLAMVVVHIEKATASATTLNAATFGGVALTPIANTFAVSSRMQTYMGYLPEAQIPAGPQTVNFQATSASGNITGIQINIASYAGVEQSAPITASTSSYLGGTTVAFPAALSYAANSITVFATGNGGAGAALVTNATGGAAFVTQSGASATTGGFSGYVAVSGVNAGAGSYTTATNAVYSGTTSNRSSLVAASINPYIPVATGTVAGTATATVLGANRVAVRAPYEEDSNANNTLLVEYKLTTDTLYTGSIPMTHSVNPYQTTITGLAESTSYDIRVTYQDANGVSGTAVQTFTVTTTAKGIEPYQTWTNVVEDTTTRTTAAAASLTGSYAVTAPAGSGRYLVVAITHHNTANVAPAAPSVISYGGVTLTLATSNRATSARSHTWLYYLKDNAVMTGNPQTLSVQWTSIASTLIRVYAAVYTGVDQTVAPVVGNGLNNTANTTANQLTAAMAVNAGRQAIYIINDVNTTNATIPGWTANANWTTPNSLLAPSRFTGTSGTYGYAHELAQRMVPMSNATDNAATSAKSVAARYSMSAMVLPPLSLSITSGSTVPNVNVYAGDTGVVVDAFTVTGSGTFSSIQVTGNTNTTSSNISAIRIYRKGDANTTVYTAGVDTLAGSGVFGAVGTTPVDIAVSETVSGTANYIIVYDVAAGAMANGTAVTFTAAVTATTPAPGGLADTGANHILYATTNVGNGAAEPANARLWKSSPATNIDAFTLKHNGITPTDDDPVTTVTVTLAPQYISGGSGGTISKFKLMEITDVAGTTVYGSSNSATTADIWNVPTTGLAATSTETTYYVRLTTADTITPSGTDTSGTTSGYYPNPVAATTITAKVTAISHSKGTSKLSLNDTGSAALYVIDMELPDGPATATAVTGATGGEIDLTWVAATDAHGGSLDPASYIIRRSAPEGTTPNPYCVDGTNLTLTPANQTGRSFTDTGLIDSFATRYYYRVCAKDAQGNVSIGATSYANAKVTSVCNNTPTISLTGEDLLSTSQVIKSTNTTPFKLLISNNDTGTCPDVNFTVTLVNEVNSIHFDKAMGADPQSAVPFPAVVTLGTGGAGAPTGKTLNVYITGKPAANQLELYKFAVQVSNPSDIHGAALTSALNTGILNDMPPIVHNSNNMGKFQYGSWGQTYTCATCHSNSTTNIKGIFEIISTPIGRRNVVFNKTSSVSGLGDAVYSDDTRPVKNVSNNVCSVCHHQTRQHQYSASKQTFNNGNLGVVGPDADEAYNTEHHNARDCVKCHTHNTAFRSIFGTCGDCHGFKASGYSPISKNTMVKDLTNALGPNPPNYGAHNRHFKAQLACSGCHSNTNHGLATTSWSGDNALQIGFAINKDTFVGFNPNASVEGGKFYGTNNLNTPFVWTPANANTIINYVTDYNNSCVTYCHGGWAGNTGAITSPIWVGDNQAACGNCHNATAAVPPTTGSHAKHALNSGAGLGIACSRCHGTYSNYSTSNAHINGNVEWKMTEFPSSTYSGSNAGSTGALAPSAAYGTCNNLYCHSNAQGSTGIGGPTFYANAKWGDPSTATCGSCHAATPNTTGSHLNHENAEVAFDCHVCHDNGGTTGPLNHANGIVNFQFIGLASNTVYSNGNNVPVGTAYGTCSNSMCHGNYKRSWGTPSSALPLCEKCHGQATSPNGFYSTQGPTGTLSVYSTGVGVHDIHIQNPNSPRKATFSRFTSFAAPMGCNQCHSVPTSPFTAGHIDTQLPAEVPFSNSSSIAHKGDLFGYYSTPTFTKATQTCSSVYCHGAGMHSNRAIDEYAGTTPPVRTNPKFTTPYLQGQTALQQCTGCHALPPAAASPASTHYGKTLNSCSSCHQHLNPDGLSFKNKALHINGIVEGGCNGCHGNPPIVATLGPTDGLATPAQNALAGGAGAHALHGTIPLIGNNCNTCHNLSNTSMPSNELEISFNGLGGQVTTGTFTGYTNSVNGPKWKVTGGTNLVKSNVPGVTCSNLYCHGGGSTSPSRAPIGGGANTTPNWEATVACGDCHGVDSNNAPSGGSHPRHALTVASLTCESCHGVTADDGTHVNGALSWKLDRANPVIGSGATYNNLSSGSLPGLVPHTSYQSCNNVYCHSTVQSGNGTGAPTYKTVQWGNNGTLGCFGCHQDMANDPAPTGSHLKHANVTSGMNVPCGYCHQDGGDGTAIHADGAVFVNFTSYVGGLYSVGTSYLQGMQKPSGSAAFGSCSATFCHGTANSPVWGTPGPLACNTCHSAKVDDINWSGRHKTHYNYSTMPTNYTQTVTDLSTADKYRFNCAHCHDDNVAKHSLKPASADSAARVFFGISTATPASSSKRGLYAAGTPQVATDNGFNYTSGSCNTSYCHSNGRGGAPLNTALNWVSTPTGGSNCLYCHDGKSVTATVTLLSGKHDKHLNPTNNAMIGAGNGFNCVDCHAQVITNSNNITIANKGKHVNAILNYSGARANNNYDGTTKVCSNVYCHSNGNANAIQYVGMTGTMAWNGAGTITACNTCHGTGNAYGYPDYANGGANTATSNLHSGHMTGLASTTVCAECHRKTGDATAANKFRAYSSLHLNGIMEVNLDKTKSYIGSNAASVTAGNQVTCSTLLCHGQGAPVWGASSTAATCQKCHGSKSLAFATYTSPQVAPGVSGGTDTTMTKAAATDPRVGAHASHLSTGVLGATVKCRDCHVPVTAVRAATHWNYTTATITFSSRASDYSHTPSVARSGGIIQCSNVACHSGKYNSGTMTSPSWNSTTVVNETGTTVGDCVACHAMPPSGYASHPAALSNSAAISTIYAACGGCHSNLSNSATNVSNVFVDKTLHINGAINAVGGACNGCHSYDTTDWATATHNFGNTIAKEGIGAHAKHIAYLKTRNSVGLNASSDTFGGAAFMATCGVCHSGNGADHSMGDSSQPRNINFGGSTARIFGAGPMTYNGASNTSSSVNPKTCFSTDCHYKVTPVWSTY